MSGGVATPVVHHDVMDLPLEAKVEMSGDAAALLRGAELLLADVAHLEGETSGDVEATIVVALLAKPRVTHGAVGTSQHPVVMPDATKPLGRSCC